MLHRGKRRRAAQAILCLASLLLASPCYAAPEWDLSYLLEAEPGDVTDEDLAQRAAYLEQNYQRYHQVDGISWVARWDDPEADHPTRYDTGGDNALFTGFYLAAATYRYLVEPEPGELDNILDTLRGLHILTHISGTPGVLARTAFRTDDLDLWRYPDQYRGKRKGHDRQYMYQSPPEGVNDVLNPSRPYPSMTFYTRATRDQVSGVLFGLSVVWAELPPAHFDVDAASRDKLVQIRAVTAEIATSLFTRLEGMRFRIQDHEGRVGTSSNTVTGLLRLQLLTLYRAVARETLDDPKELARIEKFHRKVYRHVFMFGRWGNWEDFFNRFNNIDQYYAWNLRFARAYSIWLLEDDPRWKRRVHRYIKKRLWKHVKSHKNTHFTFIYHATGPKRFKQERLDAAVWNLRALSLRPLRGWPSPLFGHERRPDALKRLFGDVSKYVVPAHLHAPSQHFVWQRDPFETGRYEDKTGIRESIGIDLLLPYWLGQHYGLIE